jgi:hypothetical protein
MQAKLYNLIKAQDPHHVVVGAIQCANAWMWTDVPSFPVLPDHQNGTAAAVIPVGVQPRLQLSLDVLLVENYDTVLADHGGGGSWSTGVSYDGTYRHGAEHEVLGNIHGLWSQGGGTDSEFDNFPAAPIQSRSMMWLGVITAELFTSLTFDSSFSWLSTTTPGGGWLQTMEVEVWAAQLEQLIPSFTARFGEVVHPTVSVSSESCVRPAAGCSRPIRARAWREQCDQPDELCVHLIVVNTMLDSPVQFGLEVAGLGLPASGANASRLFDASYNTTLTVQGGLTDWIAPGASHVYEIGCHGAPPHQTTSPTGQPADGLPLGTPGVSAWRACTNRRHRCTSGFPKTSKNNATCLPSPIAAPPFHSTQLAISGRTGAVHGLREEECSERD